jgi:hypothetical protein
MHSFMGPIPGSSRTSPTASAQSAKAPEEDASRKRKRKRQITSDGTSSSDDDAMEAQMRRHLRAKLGPKALARLEEEVDECMRHAKEFQATEEGSSS